MEEETYLYTIDEVETVKGYSKSYLEGKVPDFVKEADDKEVYTDD